MNFNDFVTLPTATPLTISELITDRIGDWEIDADDAENDARLIAEAQSRWRITPVHSCVVRPDGDIVMATAHRYVRNGVVDQTNFEVTDVSSGEPVGPGSGTIEKTIQSTGSGNNIEICNRVLYQSSGAPVMIWLDVVVN